MEAFLIDATRTLIFGLVVGGMYALGAVGVSLVFGILRFANFAHGALMTFGAYAALVAFQDLGMPIALAFVVGAVAAAALSVGVDQIVYRRLRRTAPVILLISSFGIALIIQSAVQIVWGPDNVVYSAKLQLPIHIAGVPIKQKHITILATVAALSVLVYLFLQKTRLGKAMRAMADDPDLAGVTGINTEHVVIWTWIIGGGLAGAAGVLLGYDTRLNPMLGFDALLPIFAATLLGGIGRPFGAIAGGFIIGIVGEASVALHIVSASYKPAVAFAIVVILLIFRPTGLAKGT